MAYIGNTPAEAFSAFQKQDFSTSATTSYTLDHPVSNQNEIALFINFVRQEPTAAYTASGTTLTLTSATSSSDDMYCVYLGKAVQTVNPPSGSVGSSQVAASIITGQTELATAPASTDELLISDAGVLKRIDVSLIGGTNTPSFLAKRNSDQSVSNNTDTKVAFDNVVYDTASDYDNTTNYRWTVSVAGKYFVYAQIMCDSTAGTNALESGLGWFNLNGTDMSRYQGISQYPNKTFNEIHVYMGQVWDLSVNDYIEIFGHVGGSSGTYFGGGSSVYESLFGAYKIIE